MQTQSGFKFSFEQFVRNHKIFFLTHLVFFLPRFKAKQAVFWPKLRKIWGSNCRKRRASDLLYSIVNIIPETWEIKTFSYLCYNFRINFLQDFTIKFNMRFTIWYFHQFETKYLQNLYCHNFFWMRISIYYLLNQLLLFLKQMHFPS